MTKSCADLLLRRHTLAFAAALILVSADSAVRAQGTQPDDEGAPVSLMPTQPLPGLSAPSGQPYSPTPGYRSVIPQAQTPPAAPSTERFVKGGISVDTLGEIDANAVGVLDTRGGGLGINMWAGTQAALVDRLLDRLDGPPALPTAQALGRRLLLTAARSPEGANKGTGAGLLAKRLERLLAFGDVAGANALLQVVPAREEDGDVALARLNTALLMNDRKAACGVAQTAPTDRNALIWRKALVFCQYAAGDAAKAGIGLGLLREQGIKDEAFFSLAGILGGASDKTFKPPAKLTPLLLAMMRAAGVEVSESLAQTADPAVLRAIAFSSNAGLETRLEAAETAEAAGALEPDKLRQMYTGVSFSPGDLQGALETADKLAGPRGRALLFQAARGANQPETRARLIAKTFVLARAQGRVETAMRAFQPILEEMTPTDELAWFAAEAARALYFAGGAEVAASKWAELALNRPQVPGGGGISSDVAIWPLVAIARIPVTPRAAPASAAAAPDRGPDQAQDPAGGPAAPSQTAEQGAPPPAEGGMPPLDFGSVGAGSARAMPSGGTPTAADALAGVRTVEPQPIKTITTNQPESAPQQPAAATPAPPLQPPFDDAMFDRWRKTQEGLGGAEAGQKRAALLLSLLDGLGGRVSQQAWIESAGAVREMAALPPPGLTAALDRAGTQSRVGETVLLTLAVLGTDEPEKLHPSVVRTTLEALAAAGFTGEARALAFEIAVGAGL